ncbi:MAG: FAD-dependent oxidoreductase [Clostridia bacterium]|nr:FAD-dependent oxidoreductase [Clostridia bacterium]
MAEKVIVIGGTAAGLSAASKAKRVRPELEITVFEKSGYISYGACGLPYFVGGMIAEPDDLVSLTVDQMTHKRGVPTFIHHEVTRIDREKKQVTVKNLETGDISIHPYDKLVIATGARPIVPDLPGADARDVYCLRTVEDGIRLKAVVQAQGRKRAAIIGGGFIGLEVAEEMAQSGVEVHLYEVMPRLLPFLEESFSQAVLDTLEKNGVRVHLGCPVEAIETAEGRVAGVRAADGAVPVDFVLLSVGVLPASDLARDAGLQLGVKGAIVVDDEMRTSDPAIFACGDCVQMKNRITGAAVHVPLGTTANKQGRIAGDNLAGGPETFKGVLGSMVTKCFDLYIAATGLSLRQAQEAGYDAAASIVTKGDRASYYPGSRDNTICLILDKKTGRLLGAQAIGSETVAGRVNVFVAAITAGMTVAEINELDLVYAPPVAPVYDPILIAASQAVKKVDR